MASSPDGGPDNLSKKRAAFRQLTKDDDLDAEEERTSVTETGTFKRASDEVLASRRIVKVRRTAPAPSTPNPFAAISLVPPSDLIVKGETPADKGNIIDEKDANEVSEDQNWTKDQLLQENQNSIASGAVDTQSKGDKESHEIIIGQLESTPRSDDATRNGKIEGVQPENDENGPEESDKKAEVSTEKEERVTGSFLSFQQHSFGKNAFSGSFGTGFSTSSFSFGVTPSPFLSPVGFGSLGSTPFASSLSTEGRVSSFLGKSSSDAVAPFQLFGSQEEAATLANSGHQAQATVSLSEVPVETGEEKEKVVFSADATLFEFVEKLWKERGKGEVKVNLLEDSGRKARLVMRSKGNLRLLLNANLFPDMLLSRMDNKSVTFACANSASTLKVGGLTTYALKLRDASVADNFKSVVEAYKVSLEKNTQRSLLGAPKENENHGEEVQNTTRDPGEAAADLNEP